MPLRRVLTTLVGPGTCVPGPVMGQCFVRYCNVSTSGQIASAVSGVSIPRELAEAHHRSAEGRERFRAWLDDTEGLDRILRLGAERARELSAGTLKLMKESMGLDPA